MDKEEEVGESTSAREDGYTLARSNGYSPEEIRESLEISDEEAIVRFLSKKSRNKLADENGYVFNPQTRGEKLSNAFFRMGSMHLYRDDFYQTEKGKLWYESHTPDLASIALDAHQVTYRFAKRIREGEARRARLPPKRFIG